MYEGDLCKEQRVGERIGPRGTTRSTERATKVMFTQTSPLLGSEFTLISAILIYIS